MHSHTGNRSQLFATVLGVCAVLAVAGVTRAATIPMTDLNLWLDASTGVYTDTAGTSAAGLNDTVAHWTDRSGSGNNALQADSGDRPTLIDWGGGVRAIDFSTGTSKWLGNSGTIVNPTGAKMTMFLVQYVGSGSGRQALFGQYTTSSSSNNLNAYTFASDGTLNFGHTGSWVSSSAITLSTTRLAEYTWDGSYRSIHVDGGLLASQNNATAATQSPDTWALGLRLQGSAPDPLNGAIAEVIIYERALSQAERDEVGVYLQDKYGVSGAYVPEPGTLALLTIGGLASLIRRRRTA